MLWYMLVQNFYYKFTIFVTCSIEIDDDLDRLLINFAVLIEYIYDLIKFMCHVSS